MNATPHIPVMLPEVLASLAPKDGEIYVDGTFGAGGYSRAILEAAQCHVYAIDRDPDAKAFASVLEREFPDRFAFLVGNFSDMCALLAAKGISAVNGVVLDIGVSSMQLDRAERGFSFRQDGPLDMRMSQSGISAADLVNNLEEAEIADLLYLYGEERASRRIARAIVEARAVAPIERTSQLRDICARVLGRSGDTDPATRSFQALRIRVNDELGELERGLTQAERLLAPKGRLVVVTFHSLEDRIVKRFTHSRCGKLGGVSRHMPDISGGGATLPAFFLPRPEKLKASNEEARRNPRARSATLRRAVRTEHALKDAA